MSSRSMYKMIAMVPFRNVRKRFTGAADDKCQHAVGRREYFKDQVDGHHHAEVNHVDTKLAGNGINRE